MSSKPKVYVAGVSMVTPVGVNAETTAMAVKAGISRLQISEYYSKNGKPFTMALVPEEALPEISYKLKRVEYTTLQMGAMLKTSDIAIKDVMQAYPGNKPIPLFYSGPEAYQDGPYSVSPEFIDYIIKQTNANIDINSSRLLSLGRAGVIDAIDLAIRYLQQEGTDYVLVGGADSYQEHDLLDYLDSEDRVLAQDVMNGFAPGEGAGFLLLTNDINKAMKPNAGVISLSEPGIALENGHMYSSEPYRGDGLTEAFKKALNGYNGKKIEKIYSSMNGEQFWAKEYGVATSRTKDFFAEDIQLEHPADCYGDTGGAAGALLIGLAIASLIKQNSNDTYLVTCSSDQAYRAAICVNHEL
ncbi:MAG: hypothetical protein QNL62_12060 [Gammaproteobacteria bacterium]|nr:hypothetical protein [Gammaproteobacteria bacterium]